MNTSDTPYTYGTVSKVLHWAVAALVLVNLSMGLLFDNMSKDLRFTMIMWHKSFGALVLVLMLLRLGWRAGQGFPKLPPGIAAWQRWAAHLNYLMLYPILIAMPVTGWLMSSASGYPVYVLGLFALPDIWQKNKAWAKIFKETHSVLGYVILALVIAHILAALYHHFIQGDKLIRRML